MFPARSRVFEREETYEWCVNYFHRDIILIDLTDSRHDPSQEALGRHANVYPYGVY